MFFIKERIIKEALYLLKNKSTIRQTAMVFNISKTTVHKDLTEKLAALDQQLYLKVKEVLANNLKTRHLKGGEQTRKKYKLKGA